MMDDRIVAYWHTWSACSSTDGGIVSPSARATLRLMTSSNLVGPSPTGSPMAVATMGIVEVVVDIQDEDRAMVADDAVTLACST